MSTKICSKCGIEKDIDLFVVVSRYPDGHGAECKKCHNEHNSNVYYSDIEKSRKRARLRSIEYNKRHPKRHAESFKRYRLANKEKRKETERNYRKNNPDKVKLWKKNYAEKHKEQIREKTRLRRINNREKENERSRRYRNSSPQNILKHNLRNRIRLVLKGLRRGGHLPELVGCSIDFLKKHLESKFQEGMNWDNYGKWHVDHIKPCEAFDLINIEEQKECFNWKNLQPLWGKDNISKGAKYNGIDYKYKK